MTTPLLRRASALLGVSPATPASPPTDDTARCEAWYRAHAEVIYNYLRFHLPSADLAEDLLADTFLRALRAAGTYDAARGGERPWLFRIAQNALRDWQRQQKRRQFVSLGTMRDLVHEAPSPEERLLREEEVQRLITAMAALPERDREVVSLRYGSGLDTAEVAEILGLREAVVRTRLWRALKRLREQMG